MSALVLAGVLLVAPAPYQPAHYDLSALPPYRPQQQAIGVVYEPGWRWSEHVGAKTGAQLCEVEHICYVLSGRSGLRMRDGTEKVLSAGDVFAVPAGHDSWVIGREPYVSLHLMGASDYGAQHRGR